jgi:hypothetical protein
MFPVLLASFFIFDQIVRAEYLNHRAVWEADGQPHGVFWVPQECTLAGGWLVRLGSSVAKHHRWRVWLFSTPAWMKRDQHTLHLLYWWRALVIGWHSAFVSFLLTTKPNKSLDASGGSVFLSWPDAAEGALIRAAASTQTFGVNP